MEGATHPAVGSRIEVFFESEGKYFAGMVKAYDGKSRKHEVHYDDGDEEKVKLSKHTWRTERAKSKDKEATAVAAAASASAASGSSTGATTGGKAANGSAAAVEFEDGVAEVEQSPPVGTIIDVYWESEGKFFRGRVTEYDAPRNRHKIMYTDGDVERLVLSKERWRVAEIQLNEETADVTGGRMPKVGDVIEVLWPDDNKYYSGTVKRLDRRTGKHKVLYDDGDTEDLLLANESWRWPGSSAGSGASGGDGGDDDKKDEAKVGDEVEIYWPDDEVYYPGKVSAFDQRAGKHTILYDDGDVEELNLSQEKWRFANLRKRRRVAPDSTPVAS